MVLPNSLSSYYEKFIATGEVRCIDEEIPFEIPRGWEWEKLGNIASICGGKRIPVGQSLTTVNTGHKYIRVTDMKNHSVNSNDIHYITEDIYQKIKAYYISKEDLYITVAGTIGHIGEIPEEFDNANLTENANKIVFRQMDKKFLMYCLSSDVVQSQITAFITKVGQPKLAIMRIQNLLIPVPPLKEQSRIVNAINLTMPFVDRYESLSNDLSKLNISIFELLKKSILQEAIQGKLVPQIQAEGTVQELLAEIHKEKELLVKEGKLKKSSLIDSIIYKGDDNKYYELIGNSSVCIDEHLPFQIPETWAWCKVKNLMEIQTGASFKKEQTNTNKEGIRVLRGGNILPNKYIFKDDDVFVSEEFVNPKTILKKNSLITPAVTSLENIGKMAVIEKDYSDVSAGGFVFIIKPYIQDFKHSLLLAYFLQSPFLIEAMQGITKKSGAAFYNLGKERLNELYLPLPPMAEQQRIVGKINEFLSSIMRG